MRLNSFNRVTSAPYAYTRGANPITRLIFREKKFSIGLPLRSALSTTTTGSSVAVAGSGSRILLRVGFGLTFVSFGIIGINYKILTDEDALKVFLSIVTEPHASEYIREIKAINAKIFAQFETISTILKEGKTFVLDNYNSAFKSVHEFIALVNTTASQISEYASNALKSITDAYNTTVKAVSDLQASLMKWYNDAEIFVTSTLTGITAFYHSTLTTIANSQKAFSETVSLILTKYDKFMQWIHYLLNPSAAPKRENAVKSTPDQKVPSTKDYTNVDDAKIVKVDDVQAIKVVKDKDISQEEKPKEESIIQTSSVAIESNVEEPIHFRNETEAVEPHIPPTPILAIESVEEEVVKAVTKDIDVTADFEGIAVDAEENAKEAVEIKVPIEKHDIIVVGKDIYPTLKEEEVLLQEPPVPFLQPIAVSPEAEKVATIDKVEPEDFPILHLTIESGAPLLSLKKALTDLAHQLSTMSCTAPDSSLSNYLKNTSKSVLYMLESLDYVEAEHASHLMHTLAAELAQLETRHEVEKEAWKRQQETQVVELNESFRTHIDSLEKKWREYVSKAVDAERGGRLARLDELTRHVRALEGVVVGVAESARRASVSNGMLALLGVLNDALDNGDTKRGASVWQRIGRIVDASGDELARTVYSSVSKEDLLRFKPKALVTAEFAVAKRTADRAVYVPIQGGVISYCVATIMSFLTLSWPSESNSGKLYKAGIYARYGDLEGCVRESVGQKGLSPSWSRYILQDWAQDAWHTLRILKAAQVLKAWSILSSISK